MSMSQLSHASCARPPCVNMGLELCITAVPTTVLVVRVECSPFTQSKYHCDHRSIETKIAWTALALTSPTLSMEAYSAKKQ